MTEQTIYDFRNPAMATDHAGGRRKEDLAAYLAVVNLKLLRDTCAPAESINQQIDALYDLIERQAQRRANKHNPSTDANHENTEPQVA